MPAGESRSSSFACQSAMPGNITGRLFLDENDKNNIDDGAMLEDNLAAAGVVIKLEGTLVGETQTTETDADGNFSFSELEAGKFNVTIDSDDDDIPENVAFGLVSETLGPITLAAGGTATASFPFDIITQTLNVYVFVGTDDDPGVGPVEGAVIDLYPTAADLTSATNRFDRVTTDETGAATFEFDRADDSSPQGGTDNIVFADFISVPGPLDLDVDSEDPMEVAYNSRFEVTSASDTFDVLNRKVTMAIDVLGSTGSMEELEGWRVNMFRNDTTPPFNAKATTDEDGRVIFERTVAAANLPDTFFYRLATSQAAAGTHSFSADNVPEMSDEAGRWLMYVHEGLASVYDTTDLGDIEVTFEDTDILVRVRHENDDTVGLTSGDIFAGTTLIDATLTYVDADGDDVEATLTPAAGGGGEVTFLNIPTNSGPYTLSFESNHDSLVAVTPDEMTIDDSNMIGDLIGGAIEATVCAVGDTTDEDECSALAIKWTNGLIRGNITDVTGTVFAEDVPVRVMSYSGTIQPNPIDTIVTANAVGVYKAVATEGMYIIEVMDLINGDGDTIWVFEGQRVDTVDVEGRDAVVDTDFTGIRADTEIHGVVVNDRDDDNNTVDAGEALEGVMIQLYRDNSGTPTVDADSLMAETETDANGGYIFDGLREGTYVIRAIQPSNAIVLTGFVGGSPVDTQIVNTTAIPPTSDAADQNGRSRVGNLSPRPGLPRFDYDLSVTEDPDPSHFTYLFSTGIAQGTVKDGAGDGVGGVTVTIRRCQTSAGSTNRPASGSCGATYDSSFGAASAITNEAGGFTFSNLREGVYEVRPSAFPAGFTDSNPDSRLYLIDTPADTETGIFTVVP